jgi:hypothetical protein
MTTRKRESEGDLPAVGEAGMARKVDGTGGAIGSRAGGREIFEDGGPDGEVSASGVDMGSTVIFLFRS